MYGKIFESLYEGSMVGAGPTIFAVWGYCIAKADSSGIVILNPALLAPIIGTSRVDIEQAIEYLTSPDPHSKNPEHEGRRLINMSGYAYKVVSHAIYRDIKNNQDRREYMREYMRKRRGNDAVNSVNSVNSLQSLQKLTKVNSASASVSVSVSDGVGGKGEGKGTGTRKPKRAADDLERLRSTYAPIGVDVDRELVKCRAWCAAQGVGEPTLRRFVNWLNRADRKIGGADNASPPAPPPAKHRGMAEVIPVRVL